MLATCTQLNEPFGNALLKFGIDEATIKKWNVDCRVARPDGTEGSIFDTLEDKNVGECVELCNGIYAKANEAPAAAAEATTEAAAAAEPVAEA